MANWMEVYERAEDNTLKMLRELTAQMKEERAQKEQQTPSQDTTGTTTMLQEESRRG